MTSHGAKEGGSASPVAKLAESVSWLDSELARLRGLTKEKARDLMVLADHLTRELDSDAKLVLEGIIREITREVEEAEEKLKREFEERREAELERIRRQAEEKLEEAVSEVVAKLRSLLARGASS